MADDLGTYVLVLLLGIGAVLAVGQVLLRTGQAILEEAFGDQRVARSVNGLLILMLTRIRARSRRQAEREMSFQLDAARRQAVTDPPATQPPPIMGIGSSLPR